jgi:hypothetical protein
MGRSWERQRRSRRAVLGGLLVFALLQAAVALLIELRFPGWREPFLTSRVDHYRAREAAGRRVLFLGSSRFTHGIRVGVLEPLLTEAVGQPVAVFNYGVAGGGCLTSARQWRRLERAGRPDLAVVEIVPSLLHAGWPALDSASAAIPAGELDWADINQFRALDPARAELYRDNLLARAVPTHGHRLVLASRLLPGLQPLGRRRLPDVFQDLHEDPPATKYADALRGARDVHGGALCAFRLSQQRVGELESLLADLRAAGVPTLVLVMPEGPTFRSWYAPGAWAEIDSQLRAVCAGAGATFVSARDWFEDDAFFDSHHLTVAGAARFSRRLEAEVLTPALRGRVPGG